MPEIPLDVPSDYFPACFLTEKKGDEYEFSVPEDFTFYLDVDEAKDNTLLPEKIKSLLSKIAEEEPSESIPCDLALKFDEQPIQGRAHICTMARKRMISVTFRDQSRSCVPRVKDPSLQLPVVTDWRSNFTADTRRGIFLNSIAELVLELKESLLGTRENKTAEEPHGLVVVTGATASAKSKILRGIIDLHLQDLVKDMKKRRPHLVTLEDPIEKWFKDLNLSSGTESTVKKWASRAKYETPATIPSHELFVDYTPRVRGEDVKDLKSALNDALRQTPKVFFVGETRDARDWKPLINFARSGHLVVTTAHAGSLIEAMQMLFKGVKATTPAERNVVAGSILGVVHLARLQFDRDDPIVILPSLWRPKTKGINDLTANGLAALLPGDGEDASCFGRRRMAGRMLSIAARSIPLNGEFKSKVMARATAMDLKGL